MFVVLGDRETIDQIVLRRQALASCDAAEAQDLLDYVDRARAAGEATSVGQGRRRVDSAVHELSLAMRVPVPTVEKAVARAHRLRSRLPDVWQAWHDGRIPTAHVHAIDRAACRLTRAESLAALDEVAVDRTESDASAARHVKAFADRSVGLRPLGDGMTRLTANLGSADAAAIMQSLTKTAHALPADDDRTIDQARTDLLVDTLLGRRDGGLGYRAVIGVTVPLSSLMGFSDTPGELTDRTATIPAHVIRTALADETSLLYRLVTDDVGNLMTITWLGRLAPPSSNRSSDSVTAPPSSPPHQSRSMHATSTTTTRGPPTPAPPTPAPCTAGPTTSRPKDT